jgi:ATP-binding cassette subfamily B multidrug efflux pump
MTPAGPLRRLLGYAARYRAGFAAGLSCVVLANAAGTALPWLLGRAIDALAEPAATARSSLFYAGLIIAVTIVSGAARFGMRQLLNGISRRAEIDLRDDFLEHLLRLDAGFYGSTRTGDLMSRATNDTQAARAAIGPGIMYLSNTVVTAAFALAVMVSYSLRLTLVSLIPLALLPPVFLYFGRAIHRRFERIQDHFGVLSTMVQENLSGARIVRAYNQESAQASEFEALNAEYFQRNMALARLSAVFSPLLTLIAGVGALLVLWLGGIEVIRGAMSVGDFVAFFFYLGLLSWPMMALGWVVNMFQRGAASMGRIARILDTPPAVQPPVEPIDPGPIRGGIEFRDVTFRYPGTARDVLIGLTLRVEPGQTVALVGPTGSGKSTIIALLTRRYDPTGGRILVDGVPLERIPFSRLRAAMGVVPQDAFVFSDTIAGNIALGLPDDTEANGHVEHAARTARLHETIASFPDQYETRLGERGINLSGGQRQRATLARALIRDPAILILDDALSAVDTHTESAILDELRGVLRNRTSLIVSHRVSAVMNADRIFVLDGGRIVERGTHAELIAAGGLYTSLLQRQLLAEDLESDAPLAGSSSPV